MAKAFSVPPAIADRYLPLCKSSIWTKVFSEPRVAKLAITSFRDYPLASVPSCPRSTVSVSPLTLTRWQISKAVSFLSLSVSLA